MMKKIYSKMTRERRQQFQIETYILQDENQYLVGKKALGVESIPHVNGMYDYYYAKQQKDFLCPTELICDGEVQFSFLKGKSLCQQMLEALTGQEKDAFLRLLDTFRTLLETQNTITEMELPQSDSFIEVFGSQAVGRQMDVAENLNIDMAFDNIIWTENKYLTIDYEWIFPFPVPVKFVIYRSLFAFYLRNNSLMNPVMSLEELYQYFQITEEELQIFENMNQHFNAYVYGGTEGYQYLLEHYQKSSYDVKALVHEEGLFLQLFLADQEGYHEEGAITKPLESEFVDITIPLNITKETKEIRIDPMNVPGICKNFCITILLTDGTEQMVTVYRHNAFVTQEGAWIFYSRDPQLLIENHWENPICGIRIQFQLVKAGVEQEQLFEQLEHLSNQLNAKQMELDYIKGTKAYGLFLKNKVEQFEKGDSQ